MKFYLLILAVIIFTAAVASADDVKDVPPGERTKASLGQNNLNHDNPQQVSGQSSGNNDGIGLGAQTGASNSSTNPGSTGSTGSSTNPGSTGSSSTGSTQISVYVLNGTCQAINLPTYISNAQQELASKNLNSKYTLSLAIQDNSTFYSALSTYNLPSSTLVYYTVNGANAKAVNLRGFADYVNTTFFGGSMTTSFTNLCNSASIYAPTLATLSAVSILIASFF